MTALPSRRRAAPFVTASILCLVAGCSTPGVGKQAAGHAQTMVALNDTQLGNIRGGFDVSPNLTVNFGFQQVTSVDHNIVSSIVVPNITVSPLSGGTRFSSSAPLANVTNHSTRNAGGNGSSATGLTAAVPTVVANAAGQPQPVSPSVQNSVTTSTQGQGVTTVLTQLGGGGLATIIGNTANNALVQNMTTINLAVSGLGPLLSQGRSNAALTNALSLGSAQFR